MSNNIRELYQHILDKVSVKEVIEFYNLSLIKSGRSYKTTCPFHNDHDPSLSIRQDDKVWKCFVCNESGNAISFVQKYEDKVLGNHDFTMIDAMKKVVEICQLDIDLSHVSEKIDNTKYTHNNHVYTDHQKLLLSQLDKIMKTANLYLMQSTDERGRNYLYNRGFSEELLNDLQFGFLPREQVEKLINGNSIPIDNLVDMGFVGYNKETERYYPIYDNRILIPIFDERGNVVTFSGRSMLGEEPKYLHGHNTEIFTKSNQLYNYQRAKNFAYGNKLYVVEGFMDVAGGNKLGIQNIVATMGTSFSKEQLEMIRRLNCEIVLVRDNDKAGKNAMLKEIPDLLKQGFEVSAIDLEEVKKSMALPEDVESKDLWDFANANATSEILSKHTVSGLHFMLSHEFFKDTELTTESIRKVFAQLEVKNYVSTEADKMKFIDYIETHSSYHRSDIEKILSDAPLQEIPLFRFQSNLMLNYLIQEMDTYIANHGNSTLKVFYEEEKEVLITRMHEDLTNNPNNYISEDFKKIDVVKLMKHTLKGYDKWKEHEILSTFQHDNIFDHVFVKNDKGQDIPLKLTTPQKKIVKEQFDTLSKEVQLNMGKLDELYIYNSVDDLDKILALSPTNQGSLILKSMKQQCMTKDTIMHVFSYENVFSKDVLFALDSKYKSEDGSRFKKILLFDNRIEKIQLVKDNIKQEKSPETQEETKEEDISKEDREQDIFEKEEQLIAQDQKMTFTVNRTLIQERLEDSYFVRIPRTKGKYYMHIPKTNVFWLSDETMQVQMPGNKLVEICDINHHTLEEKTLLQLFKYWEDKTADTQEKTKKEDIPKEVKEQMTPKGEEKAFTQHQEAILSFTPPELEVNYGNQNQVLKEPKKSFFKRKLNEKIIRRSFKPFTNYEIPSQRLIDDNEKTYVFQSAINGYQIFVPKKHLRKAHNRYVLTEVSSTPTKHGTISDIRLAKETSEGINFLHNLSFNELDKHLSEKNNSKMTLLVTEEKNFTNVDDNYFRIPIWLNRKYCYVLLEKNALVRVADNHIGYSATPYHEIPVYNQKGEHIDFIASKDLAHFHEEAIKERIDLEKDYEIERGD